MSYEHVSNRPVCHLFSQIDSAKAETAAALAICSSSEVNAGLAANLDNGQKDRAVRSSLVGIRSAAASVNATQPQQIPRKVRYHPGSVGDS